MHYNQTWIEKMRRESAQRMRQFYIKNDQISLCFIIVGVLVLTALYFIHHLGR